eukprot:5015058-Prymnesium_polylepis.1
MPEPGNVLLPEGIADHVALTGSHLGGGLGAPSPFRVRRDPLEFDDFLRAPGVQIFNTLHDRQHSEWPAESSISHSASRSPGPCRRSSAAATRYVGLWPMVRRKAVSSATRLC